MFVYKEKQQNNIQLFNNIQLKCHYKYYYFVVLIYGTFKTTA